MTSQMTTATSPEAGVRVERDGALLRVTLVNPEKLNTHTPATWRRLAAIESEVQDGVRVVPAKRRGPWVTVTDAAPALRVRDPAFSRTLAVAP